MSDDAPTSRPGWQVFVHGREEESGEPFAWVPNATGAEDALDQVKTILNGSPEEYDRDALAPALVAVPAGQAATTTPRAKTRE